MERNDIKYRNRRERPRCRKRLEELCKYHRCNVDAFISDRDTSITDSFPDIDANFSDGMRIQIQKMYCERHNITE